MSTGWWFGTFGLFSIYWECHHPNWRTNIFRRGRLNHQAAILSRVCCSKSRFISASPPAICPTSCSWALSAVRWVQPLGTSHHSPDKSHYVTHTCLIRNYGFKIWFKYFYHHGGWYWFNISQFWPNAWSVLLLTHHGVGIWPVPIPQSWLGSRS